MTSTFFSKKSHSWQGRGEAYSIESYARLSKTLDIACCNGKVWPQISEVNNLDPCDLFKHRFVLNKNYESI